MKTIKLVIATILFFGGIIGATLSVFQSGINTLDYIKGTQELNINSFLMMYFSGFIVIVSAIYIAVLTIGTEKPKEIDLKRYLK